MGIPTLGWISEKENVLLIVYIVDSMEDIWCMFTGLLINFKRNYLSQIWMCPFTITE